MRILHFLGVRRVPRQPEEKGISGLVRVPLELGRAQVALGHTVYVAAVGQEEWNSTWNGVHLLGLRMVPQAQFGVGRWKIDLRAHIPVVLFSRRHHFDIIHRHNYGYQRFLPSTVHVAHFHGDPYGGAISAKDRAVTKRNLDKIAQWTDAQIAVSHFVAKQLGRTAKHTWNVHVVYNGVDTTRFNSESQTLAGMRLRRRLGIAEGDVAFLYAGAFTHEKGIEHLVRAFLQVASSIQNVHLIMAGSHRLWTRDQLKRGEDETYEHHIHQLLDATPAQVKVHWMGDLASSQMPGLYAASDIVVVPSLCQEGFSLVTLEAMASGCALIASESGGIVEVLGEDGGILVPPGDEDALATNMSRLAVNPMLRRGFEEAARERSKYFSWDNAAVQLDAVYNSVVEQKRMS